MKKKKKKTPKIRSKVLLGVKELRKQGYRIKIKKRADGGYLVTSINGKAYKGASGNAIVRQKTNRRMTSKEIAQREKALVQAHMGATESGSKKTTYKYKSGKRKGQVAIKTPRITKSQRKALKKINAKLREFGSTQRIGARMLRRKAYSEHWITESGEISDSLVIHIASTSQRRASGEAYDDRVDWFKEWVRDWYAEHDLPKAIAWFDSMVERLESDPDFVWNEWSLKNAIDMVYDAGGYPVDFDKMEQMLKDGSKEVREKLRNIIDI